MKKALINLANNVVLDVVALEDMYPKREDGSLMDPYPGGGCKWFDCPDADKADLSFDGEAVILTPRPVLSLPDVPGFTSALKVAMGGAVAANALMRQYPMFYDALSTGTWADVQALIIDAHTTGVLTDAQYAGFKQLVLAHNIPVTLP